MKKYILISLGGFLGAFLRFYIKNLYGSNTNYTFPISTLIVNIIGCYFIAVTFKIFKFVTNKKSLKIGITTGLFGSFTTFSTICKDTYELIETKQYYILTFNLLFSIFFGLIAVYLGILTVKKFSTFKINFNKKGNS